jgi:hypothetical protein
VTKEFLVIRASVSELSKVMDTDEMTMYEGVWGEMHIEYDVFKQAMDITPYLKGLPNDRDPCPHWGIVVKGEMAIVYDGKREIAKAGDAYYFPPGHTGMAKAGTEVWEFSPNDKLQKTVEVINRNMQAMMANK